MKIEIIDDSSTVFIKDSVKSYNSLIERIREISNLPISCLSHVYVRIKSGLISDYAKLADWDLFLTNTSSEDVTLILFKNTVYEGDEYYCGFFVRNSRYENDFIAALGHYAAKCARRVFTDD